MVVIQLTGGLGNQLFQYAAAKSLALYHNVPLLMDISSFYRSELPELEVPREFELNKFHEIDDPIISEVEKNELINSVSKGSKFLDKLLPAHKKAIYIEPHFHFDMNFYKSQKKVLLMGGWQSEKYFEKHKLEIRKRFNINPSLLGEVANLGSDLKKINSLSIHVRRGDYLRKKIIRDWHGIMDKEYYLKSVELILKKNKPERILFFTDDPLWVKEELLPVIPNSEIASGIITKTHIEDMFLMSQCRNNIIANSSFSWWGAWLNDNPEKIVISPKKWFNKGPKDTYDLYPDGWIRL